MKTAKFNFKSIAKNLLWATPQVCNKVTIWHRFLFLFIMQATHELIKTKLTSKALEIHHFSVTSPHGRFLGQNTTCKGSTFNIDSLLYVEDIEQASQIIQDQITHPRLQMHNLTESRNLEFDQNTPDPIYLNNGQNQIQFTSSFKYLRSIIMSNLTEDAKIQARINKSQQQMGRFHHNFWSCDIDKSIKYWIYAMGPVNALLRGWESWNLNERNRKKLQSFHHSTIRRILGINKLQVIEQHISNEMVR